MPRASQGRELESPTPSAASYHNAGHAAATALIERDIDQERSCPNDAHRKRWNAEYEAMTALGSVVAERLFLGTVEPDGARNDVNNAFRHISAITDVPGEQAAYVAFLSVRVEKLLERHRDFIHHVATQLELTGSPANDIARADVERFAQPVHIQRSHR